jgi:hypothetical protein
LPPPPHHYSSEHPPKYLLTNLESPIPTLLLSPANRYLSFKMQFTSLIVLSIAALLSGYAQVHSSHYSMVLIFPRSVQAGYNCKCQDPSGKGPQWDRYTFQCCEGDMTKGCWNFRYPGPNNQVRIFGVQQVIVTWLIFVFQCAGEGNCIDSGLFDKCCKGYGSMLMHSHPLLDYANRFHQAPGAFCWE